jgi:hypothetical protein
MTYQNICFNMIMILFAYLDEQQEEEEANVSTCFCYKCNTTWDSPLNFYKGQWTTSWAAASKEGGGRSQGEYLFLKRMQHNMRLNSQFYKGQRTTSSWAAASKEGWRSWGEYLFWNKCSTTFVCISRRAAGQGRSHVSTCFCHKCNTTWDSPLNFYKDQRTTSWAAASKGGGGRSQGEYLFLKRMQHNMRLTSQFLQRPTNY